MPIRGRSLGAVSRTFANHLNRALANTVTQAPLTLTIERNRANIRFRGPVGLSSTPIQTKYGRMGPYVGQICASEIDSDGEHTLRTLQYLYALTPANHAEAQFRWECVRVPGDDAAYCRHHLQGPIPLNLSDEQNRHVTLNDLHLPTGWVPVEEVLRICIVDLGVKPLSPDWNEIFLESERQ
ncbi:hypothetical protein BH23CHL1_BH23CHL1_04150 [soil metagenome]